MGFFHIIRTPDYVKVQTEDGWQALGRDGGTVWTSGGIDVLTGTSGDGELVLSISSTIETIKRVSFRWSESIEADMLYLGDHWERAYGDLEWRGLTPERIFPWYFLAYDGRYTSGYGVKTNPSAFCFWQADTAGVTLTADIRCGGLGVSLRGRTLQIATVTAKTGSENESPFSFMKRFCAALCDKPLMPDFPVYGGNNWYYAYGKSTEVEILNDSERVSTLASSLENRPFMVLDAGWQEIFVAGNTCSGGPWYRGNRDFPDMAALAGKMDGLGVRPGIWCRPLLTVEKVMESWLLPTGRFPQRSYEGEVLDPSIPDVLEHIKNDMRRFTGWGYQLIKHDFSTFDIFGRWGMRMGCQLTEDNWCFSDRSKTTAEIIMDVYRAIREASNPAIVIGCNTVGHLGAGYFHVNRIGDDTSGREWQRTRKMGVNSLAFRMAQHGAFYAVDGDCVGLTKDIPWYFNKQWLQLLSESGTPLFVSAAPDAAGPEQEAALKAAFATAATNVPPAEPLDWLYNMVPSKWRLNQEEVAFDWYGKEG